MRIGVFRRSEFFCSEEKRTMKTTKRQAQLGVALAKLVAALHSETGSGTLFATPEMATSTNEITNYFRRLNKRGFVDLNTEDIKQLRFHKPANKRIKMFAEFTKRVNKLRKQLPAESQSTQAATALLEIVVACKKDVQP
jgi:hypothetical protein